MKLEKRLTVYLILVFVSTWAYAFGVVYPGVRAGMNYTALVAVCMVFPALCHALTRLITREGFYDVLLRPNFRGNIGKYLLAYFAPGLVTLVGAALYFLLFPEKLDWSAPLLRQVMAESGTPYEAQAVPMSMLLALQLGQSMLLGGLLNLIPALGEEWGWRGYMMPKLRESLPPLPALLLGGLIWGLWHAPLIALGHNYGTGYFGYPWTGIGAMCVFCVAMGTLLTWLTERTGSCIPAAVAHGAFNAIAGLGTMVSSDGGDPFVGPAPMGILGGMPILLLGLWALMWYARQEKAEEK